MGISLVEHNDTCGNAGTVKEIRRQADDALDVATTDEFSPYSALSVAAKKNPVRKVDSSLSNGFETTKNVEEEGNVAILRRWHAEGKSLELVFRGVEPIAPRLKGERRIGDDEVEGLERALLRLKVGTGQDIILPDLCRRTVVENHVHPRQGRGRVVHFLSVECEVDAGRALGFIVGFQQERARTTGGIVDCLVGALGAANTNDLRHNTRDFRRGIKLS